MGHEAWNYYRLKDYSVGLGASLFGVARLKSLKHDLIFLSPDTVDSLPYGISLAVRLSDKVIEDLEDRPTRLYLHHYRQVNYFLDQLALKISFFVQEEGWQALPIPASQVLDWEKQKGHLSHKKVAQEAGLGWRGRSNLLVSPKYGARIRLVTILTDFPLQCDQPQEGSCGSCERCLSACPAQAIKENQKDFDPGACFEQLRYFRKRDNVAHYICGLCVKACRGRPEWALKFAPANVSPTSKNLPSRL
ncbi:MAG: 4Fe-4S double cluster binding domain-containing protein [bacterium]